MKTFGEYVTSRASPRSDRARPNNSAAGRSASATASSRLSPASAYAAPGRGARADRGDPGPRDRDRARHGRRDERRLDASGWSDAHVLRRAAQRTAARGARRRGRSRACDRRPARSRLRPRPARGPRAVARGVIRFGYKASAEQFGPRELLDFSVLAEQLGLEIVAVSDHFQPWRHHGGHGPAALTWLGALGERTEGDLIGTSVLTPAMRHQPANVAAAF